MSQASGHPRATSKPSARELARIGGAGAAGAFSSMLNLEVSVGELHVRAWSNDPAGRELETGVFFEMEGAVTGLLGVFLPRALGAVLGTPLPGQSETSPAAQESVLREVANIVASHAVSAIADSLAGRVTLTVPVLAVEGAAFVFGRMLAARREAVARVTCEMALASTAAGLRAHLVLAPDAP